MGNRQTGCLIWGQPGELRFSLDRTDIWDRSTPSGTQSQDFNYQTFVQLARQKDTNKIREIFDRPYNDPTPTKLPAGKIILRFLDGENVESFLDLSTAEALLSIQTSQTERKVRCCSHATEEIGMMSVEAAGAAFEIELVAPEFGRKGKDDLETRQQKRDISQGSLRQLIYEEPVTGRKEFAAKGYAQWFIQKVQQDFSYGIAMFVSKKEDKTEIFYKIATSSDGAIWMENAITNVEKMADTGYKALFLSHKDWWKQFFEESSIRLPDKNLEKMWYVTNYLFGSCSGKGYFPMPLQGVWTADNGELPPWKGDYHHDLNTQLSYCHFLKANHLDAGLSFVEFLWNTRQAAETFAKEFYHTKGICLPAVMTIDGKALGGWPMYSLSPTNQIWLCRSFEQYYTYTGDETFLKQRAYPYFAQTAECICGLLCEGEDGRYYLPISSSPEIHDDEAEAFVTPNSNYDLSLLIYLFQTLAVFAEQLDKEEKCRWQKIVSKLSPLAVNQKQVLMLSPDESLKESHRHLSNAMAVYPLNLLRYGTEEEKRIIDATILDFETLGSGMWVGFSFTWMAELYAIQKNGEGAASRLNIFWENFCSPNGFHLNGDYKNRGFSSFHYRPFTMEASICAADALQEMLMQMHGGNLELFPSIPKDWKTQEVAFEQLRGEGGLLISAVLSQGILTSLEIESPREQQLCLRGLREIAPQTATGQMEITLQKGRNCIHV